MKDFTYNFGDDENSVKASGKLIAELGGGDIKTFCIPLQKILTTPITLVHW